MEKVVREGPSPWADRSVLVTGHTGFKGGWLSLWLRELGASVHGYSLEPLTDPSFFEVASVSSAMASDARADLADLARLRAAFEKTRPSVVFHLAAQPLVRASYRDPIGTLQTNVMGTANVLEAARHTDSVRAVVVITTDKVYHNREWAHPYREDDALGGRDPYSASKAAAEIVAATYRASFFSGDPTKARIATARAGNVVGGGDWATDRLVPDCMRAFEESKPVSLRNAHAIRPWQHVLEPVSGYLRLAERLLSSDGEEFAQAWNFGPDMRSNATVEEVASLLAKAWGDGARVEVVPDEAAPHEAGTLRLDSTRAVTELGWEPRWSLERALGATVAWHRAKCAGKDMTTFSLDQIRDYTASAPE